MEYYCTKDRIAKGEWSWELSPETESFEFECSACGECCRGDMTIFLNLWDLQRMAQFLGFEFTGELFIHALVREVALENGGFRPAIQFKQAVGIQFCPFLENRLCDNGALLGLCKLHPALKPLVCKMAPLGREVEFDGAMQLQSSRWLFTEPVKGCPGCRSTFSNLGLPWMDRHCEELNVELKYFKVVELLQRQSQPIESYRNIYDCLRVNANVDAYLDELLNALQ